MATVVIIGAGAMGTALSFPLADSGHEVHLVGTHLDRDWIGTIVKTGYHPRLKPAIPDRVIAHYIDELPNVMKERVDLLVLGVNSAGISWAIETLRAIDTQSVPLLILTKGLVAAENTLEVLPRHLAAVIDPRGNPNVRVGGVAGPCIASELAAGRDSSVVFALSADGDWSEALSLFSCPYYHIRVTTDLVGAEMCAALKNFFTIGVAYPLGFPGEQATAYNPSAGLFSQAVREMSYLVSELGGVGEQAYGLPGVGDLYVTCQAGRNSRYGAYLGGGLRPSEIQRIHMAGETVEGAQLAFDVGPTILKLCRDGTIDQSRIPLSVAIINAICNDEPLKIEWEGMNRG